MSKTFALCKRISPYLAEKASNLIDAMLLSTEEIGWDSQQQLIVNGRVYHDTDIVRLIAYIMSPADSISKKPIGLQVFISALRKIGLESDYVINQNVKRFLRKNNQSNDDDTESTDHDSEDEKEYETSDYNDSNGLKRLNTDLREFLLGNIDENNEKYNKLMNLFSQHLYVMK